MTRGRTTYTQNTAKIGKSPAKRAEPADHESNGEALDDEYEPLPAAVEPEPPTVFEHLQYWWKKADSAAQTRFRLWIDGNSKRGANGPSKLHT